MRLSAESLDIGSGTGTREGMYRAAVNYLEMQAKYDGSETEVTNTWSNPDTMDLI